MQATGGKELWTRSSSRQANTCSTNYCFPSAIRTQLVRNLSDLFPEPNKKVFLLTTGSEAVECAIKLCRTQALKVAGRRKNVIVSYDNAFHGRTLGSQQAGGIPSLKEWIVNLDPGFVQAPFPDGFRVKDTSFGLFEKTLAARGVEADRRGRSDHGDLPGRQRGLRARGVHARLRAWCDRHQVLLVLDEVQAGFGRTGTLFGYEHYGILPDLNTFGKGISSSLPLSAVVGRRDVMNLHPAGSMTSTHTGNPVCCAAALASIDLVLGEDLAGNSARMGAILHQGLLAMKARQPQHRCNCREGPGSRSAAACGPGRKSPTAISPGR